MKCRVVIIILILTLFFVTGLSATKSRIAVVGNPLTVGFVRDITDIYYFPGAMNYYPRTILAELDYPYSKDNWEIYANLPFMDNVLGLYLNVPVADYDEMWEWGDHSDYQEGMLNIERGVGLGFGFNDNLGLIFSMAMDSRKIPIDNNNDFIARAGAYSLAGGYSTDIFDLGLRLGLFNSAIENELSQEELTSVGISLDLKGRYFLIEESDFAAMAIMGFEFATGSGEIKYEEDDWDDAESLIAMDIGVGVNFNIDDNNKVIAGIKPFALEIHMYENYGQDEYSATYLWIPQYQVALESRITRWLTGRVGARQAFGWLMEKEDPSNAPSWEESQYLSAFEMNLGLGFHFGNFTIDTVLMPDFLFNGPEFIGGNASGLASQVSVKYNF